MNASSLINSTSAGLTVTGTAGSDILQGSIGDDTFTTGLGNDVVNAGAGADTVILPMFPGAFHLIQTSPGHVAGSYGTSTVYTLALNDVETVQFGTEFQTTIPLSELTSGNAQVRLSLLTDLYLAFFGRAPDVSGLEFWQEKLLEGGRDFALISRDFAWSVEARELFPQAASNRDFVETVYMNCFGRRPDSGGWDYWTARLDGLGTTDLNERGEFVGAVLLGAYAITSGMEDRTLLTNRHEAALYYVNKLAADPAEGFDTAINDLLAKVSDDPGTEDSAEDVIDYTFANPIHLTGVMNDLDLFYSIWDA